MLFTYGYAADMTDFHDMLNEITIAVTDTPAKASMPGTGTKDELYCYCCNLAHWALQLMSMNDTAKEGDITRLQLNCKAVIPFFFSHSTRSKYLVENVDFLLKTQHLLSPLQSLQLLDCSFVNAKGGRGQNKELDLAMENHVGNSKTMIKHLASNKTESAICRATLAAEAVASVVDNLRSELHVSNRSGRHTHTSTENDEAKILATLREIRPFVFTPHRTCRGFDKLCESPYLAVDTEALHHHILRTVNRLSIGLLSEDSDNDTDTD